MVVTGRTAQRANDKIDEQIRKISERMTAVTAASAAANASSSNPYAWNGVLASKSTGASTHSGLAKWCTVTEGRMPLVRIASMTWP